MKKYNLQKSRNKIKEKEKRTIKKEEKMKKNWKKFERMTKNKKIKYIKNKNFHDLVQIYDLNELSEEELREAS